MRRIVITLISISLILVTSSLASFADIDLSQSTFKINASYVDQTLSVNVDGIPLSDDEGAQLILVVLLDGEGLPSPTSLSSGVKTRANGTTNLVYVRLTDAKGSFSVGYDDLSVSDGSHIVTLSYGLQRNGSNVWGSSTTDRSLFTTAPTIIPASFTVGDTSESTYTAYLNTDATEIAPGGTYTADIYMKSDDALSAGEIDLAAANGKITNIALADGIGMTQVDDVSDGKTEAKISFDGNTASAKEGLKIATITVQAADSLTDGSSVELNISNAVAAKTGSTKDQIVTLGEDAKVAVPVITAANCSCESYAAGKYLVKYTGTVADGEVAKYGEEEMFWSPKYASWVYLTNSDVSQTLRDSRFSSVSGTKKDLTCTGDVNGNSVVNIVDAQVAYDIANSVYSDFTNPTMEQWLMADVNADSMVDASDARAIQCIVHGLTG